MIKCQCKCVGILSNTYKVQSACSRGGKQNGDLLGSVSVQVLYPVPLVPKSPLLAPLSNKCISDRHVIFPTSKLSPVQPVLFSQSLWSGTIVQCR